VIGGHNSYIFATVAAGIRFLFTDKGTNDILLQL
jgi:hypothetical protein